MVQISTGSPLGSSVSMNELVGTDLTIGSRVIFFGLDYDSIGQGTWVFPVNTSQHFSSACQNSTTADGDNISFKVWLAKGTYSITLDYWKNNNQGIIKIDIDGTTVMTVDQYNSSATSNMQTTETGINVSTSGLKTITFKVDGKNASSSDYWGVFSAIIIRRTG